MHLLEFCTSLICSQRLKTKLKFMVQRYKIDILQTFKCLIVLDVLFQYFSFSMQINLHQGECVSLLRVRPESDYSQLK